MIYSCELKPSLDPPVNYLRKKEEDQPGESLSIDQSMGEIKNVNSKITIELS